jgi:hypothetical protein
MEYNTITSGITAGAGYSGISAAGSTSAATFEGGNGGRVYIMDDSNAFIINIASNGYAGGFTETLGTGILTGSGLAGGYDTKDNYKITSILNTSIFGNDYYFPVGGGGGGGGQKTTSYSFTNIQTSGDTYDNTSSTTDISGASGVSLFGGGYGLGGNITNTADNQYGDFSCNAWFYGGGGGGGGQNDKVLPYAGSGYQGCCVYWYSYNEPLKANPLLSSNLKNTALFNNMYVIGKKGTTTMSNVPNSMYGFQYIDNAFNASGFYGTSYIKSVKNVSGFTTISISDTSKPYYFMNPYADITVNFLLIGGGASGTNTGTSSTGGGGGAGAIVSGSFIFVSNTYIKITIGTANNMPGSASASGTNILTSLTLYSSTGTTIASINASAGTTGTSSYGLTFTAGSPNGTITTSNDATKFTISFNNSSNTLGNGGANVRMATLGNSYGYAGGYNLQTNTQINTVNSVSIGGIQYYCPVGGGGGGANTSNTSNTACNEYIRYNNNSTSNGANGSVLTIRGGVSCYGGGYGVGDINQEAAWFYGCGGGGSSLNTTRYGTGYPGYCILWF